jgi:hypothetical protein
MRKMMFQVTRGNAHYFTWAYTHAEAKRNAFQWFGHDDSPEHEQIQAYKATALTAPGDRTHIALTLFV